MATTGPIPGFKSVSTPQFCPNAQQGQWGPWILCTSCVDEFRRIQKKSKWCWIAVLDYSDYRAMIPCTEDDHIEEQPWALIRLDYCCLLWVPTPPLEFVDCISSNGRNVGTVNPAIMNHYGIHGAWGTNQHYTYTRRIIPLHTCLVILVGW